MQAIVSSGICCCWPYTFPRSDTYVILPLDVMGVASFSPRSYMASSSSKTSSHRRSKGQQQSTCSADKLGTAFAV